MKLFRFSQPNITNANLNILYYDVISELYTPDIYTPIVHFTYVAKYLVSKAVI